MEHLRNILGSLPYGNRDWARRCAIIGRWGKLRYVRCYVNIFTCFSLAAWFHFLPSSPRVRSYDFTIKWREILEGDEKCGYIRNWTLNQITSYCSLYTPFQIVFFSKGSKTNSTVFLQRDRRLNIHLNNDVKDGLLNEGGST